MAQSKLSCPVALSSGTALRSAPMTNPLFLVPELPNNQEGRWVEGFEQRSKVSGACKVVRTSCS